MVNETLKNNALDLEKDLAWFAEILDTRLRLFFRQDTTYKSISEIKPPVLEPKHSLYNRKIEMCAILKRNVIK